MSKKKRKLRGPERKARARALKLLRIAKAERRERRYVLRQKIERGGMSALREDYEAQLRIERAKRRHTPSAPKTQKEEYLEHLMSDTWITKRDAVMALHDRKCVVTGNFADDMHHITYIRFKRELPMDLMPICRSVHEEIHRAPGKSAEEKTRFVLGHVFVNAYIEKMKDWDWVTLENRLPWRLELE